MALRRARTQVLRSVQRYPLVSAVAAVSVLLGLAISIISFALQTHFTGLYANGQRLSGWQNFLRLGAPWQALVPVVLACLLATWGALRLSGTQAEPPLSLRGAESATATELRRGLRAERRTVRRAFVIMVGLVVIVVIRLIVYSVLAIAGNRVAASTWVGVAVELGFWLVAGGAFWNWNRCHRLRMEGWGVYDD
jgi:hypothetical protein